MKHKFLMIISLLILSGTILSAQKNDATIKKEYQRIDKAKSLIVDSLTLIRGKDYKQGAHPDKKKYKIYKEKKRIVKMEYEEIGAAGDKNREWNKKTTIYLKNNVPFYIVENLNGTVILRTLNEGEKSKPFKQKKEIYVNNWEKQEIKTIRNGHEETPQMKIDKQGYEELIEKIKQEFNAKR